MINRFKWFFVTFWCDLITQEQFIGTSICQNLKRGIRRKEKKHNWALLYVYLDLAGQNWSKLNSKLKSLVLEEYVYEHWSSAISKTAMAFVQSSHPSLRLLHVLLLLEHCLRVEHCLRATLTTLASATATFISIPSCVVYCLFVPKGK